MPMLFASWMTDSWLDHEVDIAYGQPRIIADGKRAYLIARSKFRFLRHSHAMTICPGVITDRVE